MVCGESIYWVKKTWSHKRLFLVAEATYSILPEEAYLQYLHVKILLLHNIAEYCT